MYILPLYPFSLSLYRQLPTYLLSGRTKVILNSPLFKTKARRISRNRRLPIELSEGMETHD